MTNFIVFDSEEDRNSNIEAIVRMFAVHFILNITLELAEEILDLLITANIQKKPDNLPDFTVSVDGIKSMVRYMLSKYATSIIVTYTPRQHELISDIKSFVLWKHDLSIAHNSLQEDIISNYPAIDAPHTVLVDGLLNVIENFNSRMLAGYKAVEEDKRPKRHPYSVKTLLDIVNLYIQENRSLSKWPEGSSEYEFHLLTFITTYLNPTGLSYEVVRAAEILEKANAVYKTFNPTLSAKIIQAIALLDETHNLAC